MTRSSSVLALACVSALMAGCSAEGAAPEERPELASESAALRLPYFYTAPPRAEAVQQVASLLRARRLLDAARLTALLATPQGNWFTAGSPQEVRAAVSKVTSAASRLSQVPVLVAYNIPFRDCSLYSAGGAADSAAYAAWIEGFARGIGQAKVVVILEPDGLGIIPNNTTIYGATDPCQLWQKDAEGSVLNDENGQPLPLPGASPSERYAQLSQAITTLSTLSPNAEVYLDGTHSAWLGVGEAAYRLVQAGVERTHGFFLNTSNYELTSENTQFGSWVSSCIAAGTAGPDWARGHFDWCPSQYNPALDYALDYSPENAEAVTAGIAGLMGDALATTHFVIDTGRNGRGPWSPTAEYPDAQVWCNAPARGAGERPSTRTANSLLDAYLWIKKPGESDGSCSRGLAGSGVDPEWGIVDPAAGAWFPEQALSLARGAVPKLL